MKPDLSHLTPPHRDIVPGSWVKIDPYIAVSVLLGYRSLEFAARNRVCTDDVVLEGRQRGLAIAFCSSGITSASRIRWVLVLSSSGLFWVDVRDIRRVRM